MFNFCFWVRLLILILGVRFFYNSKFHSSSEYQQEAMEHVNCHLKLWIQQTQVLLEQYLILTLICIQEKLQIVLWIQTQIKLVRFQDPEVN